MDGGILQKGYIVIQGLSEDCLHHLVVLTKMQITQLGVNYLHLQSQKRFYLVSIQCISNWARNNCNGFLWILGCIMNKVNI